MNKPRIPSTVDQIELIKISDKVKHSLALLTSLPSSIKFSEPTMSTGYQPFLHDSTLNVPNYVFREPLKEVEDEDTAEFDQLAEKLQSMWIDVVNVDKSLSVSNPFHDSNQEDNSEIVDAVSNDYRTVDMGRDTQVTHLDVNLKEIHPPATLPKNYDKQPLPLLLKDVHTITWPNQDEVCYASVMDIYGQPFETVMVYGIVTSLNVENNGLLKRFVIDDGSDSISAVWKANKIIVDLIRNIHSLEEELKLCQVFGLSVMGENWQPTSAQCKEMFSSLTQIIGYMKREATKRMTLKRFGHAAVVAKPIRIIGKQTVTLLANHIQDDSGIDRSLELYFKQNLIRLYEEKYCRNT